MEITKEIQQRITKLFEKQFKTAPTKIELLTSAGSPRKYYRIHSELERTIIACEGNNLEENKTFIYLCENFHNKGLAVPMLYIAEDEPWIYLLEDFGGTDLLTAKEKYSQREILDVYKKVIIELIAFQFEGAEDLDFSKCFVSPEFDEAYMKFDLNYFKENYLIPSKIEYSEEKLEADFNSLISYLRQADFEYFMYRDFQSRNILIQDNEPYFIDFQGGMKGPLHYDLVSLLHQATAELSDSIKEALLTFYLDQVQKNIYLDTQLFRDQFEAFALLRILQTLGAYGNRGIKEGKPHFIASIPAALKNLDRQIPKTRKAIDLPYLYEILHQLPILK